jgi:hypothetical protein
MVLHRRYAVIVLCCLAITAKAAFFSWWFTPVSGAITAIEALAEMKGMGAEYLYWWNSSSNTLQWSGGLGEWIVTTLDDYTGNGGDCTAGFLANSPYYRTNGQGHIYYNVRAHDGFGENLMGAGTAQSIGISGLIRTDSDDAPIIGRGPANGGALSIKYGQSIVISESRIGAVASSNSTNLFEQTAYDVGYGNDFSVVAAYVGNSSSGTKTYFLDLTTKTGTTAENSFGYGQANQAVGGDAGSDTVSLNFYGAAFFTNTLDATDSARVVVLLDALKQDS